MKRLICCYLCKVLKDQRKGYFLNVYYICFEVILIISIDPEFIVKLPYKCLPDESLIEINKMFDKYEKGDMDISNDSEASLLLHLSVAADH